MIEKCKVDTQRLVTVALPSLSASAAKSASVMEEVTSPVEGRLMLVESLTEGEVSA